MLGLDRLLAEGRPPDHPVAVRHGRAVDFAAFADRAAAWRRAFSDSDSGSPWAFFFEDSLEFAAALLGAWHQGVCVHLLPDTREATLAAVRDRVSGFAGDLPADLAPLTLAPDARPPSDAGPRPRSGLDEWLPLDPHAPALVVVTSGSTGAPVPVPKRLDQLLCELETLETVWGDQLADARVVSTVSHQHVYGLLFRVLWPLVAGRPFEVPGASLPEQVLGALQRGPLTLVASPAHLKRLPERLDWASARGNLRAVFSSGGPLPDEVQQRVVLLLGREPVEVFGSTETGGVAWRRRSGPGPCPWRPLPGVQWRAEGDELLVRSAHLADGDWYRTSDRIRREGDGFELLGRRDRIVKVEGKRVSLAALEHALLEGGLLREVRVVELAGAREGLGVVAVPTRAGWRLYDEHGRRGLNEQLRAAAARHVEPTALPRRFRYVEALPSNPQGKCTQALLRDLFDPLAPQARVLMQEDDHARVAVEAAASSPFFEGHFPGRPVLPGVVQLGWAVRLSRGLFAIAGPVRCVEEVKFRRSVTPGALLEVELWWQPERGLLRLQISSKGAVHTTGRLRFGDAAC